MRNVDAPTPGRLTSVQACELFALRRASPTLWSVDALAARYQVDGDAVRRVLRHNVQPALSSDQSGTLGWWQVR